MKSPRVLRKRHHLPCTFFEHPAKMGRIFDAVIETCGETSCAASVSREKANETKPPKPNSGHAARVHRLAGLSWDGENRIYVTNADGTKLEAWGVDGQFEEQYRLIDVGLRGAEIVGFLDSTRAVLASYVMERFATRVSVYDIETEQVLTEFVVDATPTAVAGSMNVGERVPISAQPREILAGNLGGYSIRAFDEHGVVRASNTMDIGALKVPGVYDTGTQQGMTPLGDLSALRLGAKTLSSRERCGHQTWNPPTRWPETVPLSRAWEARFDVFNGENLDHVATVPMESKDVVDMGRLVAADSHAIYTLSDTPYPHVRRFELQISPWER